jgi:hypothetical protein
VDTLKAELTGAGTDCSCRAMYKALSYHSASCWKFLPEEERERCSKVCREGWKVTMLARCRVALGCSRFVGMQGMLGLKESEFEGFVLRFLCIPGVGMEQFKRSVSEG